MGDTNSMTLSITIILASQSLLGGWELFLFIFNLGWGRVFLVLSSGLSMWH